jgi:RNA polymerase sigma-70 factor (ECF subfamily)|tara:strand:+ start:23715 stop:24293 length:579 start_codon:yes stop_codon:yes gene_type:complete
VQKSQSDAQVPENALIAEAAKGSKTAFNRVMNQQAPRLQNIALRMMGNSSDAEDAVQEALAAAWFKLASFDLSRPISPWLTRITVNKCRDLLRKRRIRQFFEFHSDNEAGMIVADDAPDPSAELQARQALEVMQKEITRLPATLREPFVLVTFGENSQAEAAHILGISEKAVETRIYRARNRLREISEKFEG